jgi:hypothetical protein
LAWPSWRWDDVERDALAGELDGVGVAELARREAAPDRRLGASRRNSTRRLALDDGDPRESGCP